MAEGMRGYQQDERLRERQPSIVTQQPSVGQTKQVGTRPVPSDLAEAASRAGRCAAEAASVMGATSNRGHYLVGGKQSSSRVRCECAVCDRAKEKKAASRIWYMHNTGTDKVNLCITIYVSARVRRLALRSFVNTLAIRSFVSLGDDTVVRYIYIY